MAGGGSPGKWVTSLHRDAQSTQVSASVRIRASGNSACAFPRALISFFPGRNSVAPLCYNRHVHTQMTYLLKCQLRELCFRGLSSPLLDVCISSSSAGCSFALIFPSPCSPSPVLTFPPSLRPSVALPSPGEAFVGVSAEAGASVVQDCASRLSDAGDRLQDPGELERGAVW